MLGAHRVVTGGPRLIVWRHGETAHNVGGIWQGQLDTELSACGREQAGAAARALADQGVTRIVSSDLRRAASTAQALAEVTGLPVRYDERWREIHVGRWQGMSHGDVAERYPDAQAALERGEDIVRGEHGESVAQVQERALAALQDALAGAGESDTAVVATHGVTARTLCAALVGLPQQQAWLALAGLRNCHWAALAQHRTGWRLTSWNTGVTASVAFISDR